jgi:hypothetical protein
MENTSYPFGISSQCHWEEKIRKGLRKRGDLSRKGKKKGP